MISINTVEILNGFLVNINLRIDLSGGLIRRQC